MTELTVHGEPVARESDLVSWARDAREAHTIAVSLVKTSFVPDSMRNKPEEAAAAILTGAEIGLTPMAALRSIDIIQGTPAMRAHALRGLVQGQGHEVWVEEATATKAVVQGRRKGSDRVQESVWTIQRAQGLNLTSKQNWKNQPQAMLVARATSELCRLIASDVLIGLPYSTEEIEDSQPEPGAKKITRRKLEAVPVEEPPLEEGTPAEEPAKADEPEQTEPDLDWPDVVKPGDA